MRMGLLCFVHAGKRDVFSPCWGNGGAEMKIFVSVLWAVWVGSSMMAVWTIWNIIMELGG